MANTHNELVHDAGSSFSAMNAAEWSADLVSRTGVRLRVRPAAPPDEEDLGAFFRSLSSEDLRHRFLTGLREVGQDRLREMVRSDDPHSINFLAIDPGTGTIIATAMLVASPDHAEGEFALATRAESQQQGVSWTLLEHLLRYAEAAGIRLVKSIETSDDARALQLEREMGFRVHRFPDDPTLMVAEKDLGPA